MTYITSFQYSAIKSTTRAVEYTETALLHVQAD